MIYTFCSLIERKDVYNTHLDDDVESNNKNLEDEDVESNLHNVFVIYALH